MSSESGSGGSKSDQSGSGETAANQGVLLMWISLGVVSGFGMALAAWLLIAPDVGPPPTIPFQDKIFHLVAFACLAGPAALVLPRRYLGFWIAHMLALGAGVEVVQMKMAVGRNADITDFIADAIGIAIALAIARLVRRSFEA